MNTIVDKLPEMIGYELQLIWSAHRAVGLTGYMCLYTHPEQVPFRAKQANIQIWFNEEETPQAIQDVITHYNGGMLPNSPLLLSPIVHEKVGSNSYRPLGSGIVWSTSLCLGIDTLKDDSQARILDIGVFSSTYHRGANQRSGLKIVGICDSVQPLLNSKDASFPPTVSGCQELYDLANINSDQYCKYYMLSGISYLTNNGLFLHPDIRTMLPENAPTDKESCDTFVERSSVAIQNILDATYCWNAYERHHSLYQKFGTDRDSVDTNLRFFNMVARDVQLFDATGPMRKDADVMMEFLMPGLIPRGAVTLIAAPGGAGKSTLVHQLCILASIDYEPGEEAPKWLGQRLAIEKCRGVNVYFAGEDSPAIINARANTLDPEGRARRLMFQRTDFGPGVTFAQHIQRLHKIPEISIIVVDPARKYIGGDENSPTAVSDFFDALEDLAVAKNAAVIVVHNLQKGAVPKSIPDIVDLLRGAEAFVDRPRVIVGMMRDGKYTVVGLSKNNIPPNIGMMTEERVFARDPKHLSLLWLPGNEGVRNADLSDEELARLAEEAKRSGH